MTTIRKRAWTAPNGDAKTAWLVDYRDGTGKRRFKQFARKKDADEWFTQAGWEVSKGIHTADTQSATIGAACDIWIKRAETEGLERGTIAQYRQLADLHIKPFLGAEKLSRLKASQVEAYRDELLACRSKAMARKAIRALSSVLGEAMRRGLVAQNVATGVKFARMSRAKSRVAIPTREDLNLLLSHAGDDFKPLLMTAILTGLRASELRGIVWENINLKGAVLTVSQRADKFNQIGLPKSKAGHRSIPISGALVATLREWKLRCPNGELGLVFPNNAGNVSDYAHLLRRRFQPLQIAAGICDPVVLDGQPKIGNDGGAVMEARYGFHALRHAAASAWIKQRIDLKRLQVWIGHESIQLTLDTYGHLIDDTEEDARLIEASHAELIKPV